jgi:biotin operon repressor
MLHNEERQRIIQALLSADNKGLSQNELAESTFIPETKILKHLDSLLSIRTSQIFLA